MPSGYVYAAIAAYGLLSDIFGKKKNKKVTTTEEYEPVDVKLSDGTIVRMRRPTGRTIVENDDGGTKTSDIADAITAGYNAYSQGAALSGKTADPKQNMQQRGSQTIPTSRTTQNGDIIAGPLVANSRITQVDPEAFGSWEDPLAAYLKSAGAPQ